jgi:hypothetical protein
MMPLMDCYDVPWAAYDQADNVAQPFPPRQRWIPKHLPHPGVAVGGYDMDEATPDSDWILSEFLFCSVIFHAL